MNEQPIPIPTENNVQLVLRRIKMVLDSLTGVGGGDGSQRAVRVGDLSSGTTTGSTGSTGGGGSGVYDPTTDPTIPPAPDGITIASGFGTYTISWRTPTGLEYRNPSYAEIWRGDTNVLGNATLVGTSASNFFTLPGTMGQTKYFWVRFVSQADIFGPFDSTLGNAGAMGTLGGADLSGLVITAANLADGAVDLTSNKVTAATNFGAIAVGYTVTQYLLASSGVMANLVVDDAQIANLSAAKLTVGDGTVGGILKSGNWASLNAGWKLNTDGTAELNSIYARGQINGGAFTNYAWPSSGTGFHLSASGLLIGNLNTGNYFQVEGAGNVFAPNFAINNGNVTIRGHIAGGAITTYAWPAAGAGGGFYLGPEGLLLGNGNDNKYFQFDVATGEVLAPQFNIIGGNATFAGNLSGASGTFGTITSGMLQNAAGTAWVNLNASGSTDFIHSPGVRITADGDAYFTQSLASGTWTGSIDLIASGGTARFGIDTGHNKALDTFSDRTLTARVSGVSVTYAPTESTGSFIDYLDVEIRPQIRKPLFAGSVDTLGQNPYGTGHERVFLDVEVSLQNVDSKTVMTLTGLTWTLDTVG